MARTANIVLRAPLAYRSAYALLSKEERCNSNAVKRTVSSVVPNWCELFPRTRFRSPDSSGQPQTGVMVIQITHLLSALLGLLVLYTTAALAQSPSVRTAETLRGANTTGYVTEFERRLRAANFGDTEEQVTLGVMYYHGSGVDRDDVQALKWFRRAAAEGSAAARNNLGLMYLQGRGVPKDWAEGLRLIKGAAEKGYVPAQGNLGLAYWQGVGIGKNRTEAVHWLRRAAKRGYAPAEFGMGIAYDLGEGVDKNQAAAAKWYRKAAKQGLAAAQSNLGLLYMRGEGVTRNYREAVNLYLQAAEQGDSFAYRNLAYVYSQGLGVPRDHVAACTWLVLAQRSGENVQGILTRLLASLSPADRQQALARASEWQRLQTAPSKELALK
jgi:TPR repeat protein